MYTIKTMLIAAIIQSITVKGGRWPAPLPFDDFFFVLSSIDTALSYFLYRLPGYAA